MRIIIEESGLTKELSLKRYFGRSASDEDAVCWVTPFTRHVLGGCENLGAREVPRKEGSSNVDIYATGAPRYKHERIMKSALFEEWQRIFEDAQDCFNLERIYNQDPHSGYTKHQNDLRYTQFVAWDKVDKPMEKAIAWIAASRAFFNRHLYGSVAKADAKRLCKKPNTINLASDTSTCITSYEVIKPSNGLRSYMPVKNIIKVGVALPLALLQPKNSDPINFTATATIKAYENTKGQIFFDRAFSVTATKQGETREFTLSSAQETAISSTAMKKIVKRELHRRGFTRISTKKDIND